jgi:hypothetical protein
MVCRAERNGRASEASLREEDELSSSPASGEDLATGLQPKRLNRWDSEDAIRYLHPYNYFRALNIDYNFKICIKKTS